MLVQLKHDAPGLYRYGDSAGSAQLVKELGDVDARRLLALALTLGDGDVQRVAKRLMQSLDPEPQDLEELLSQLPIEAAEETQQYLDSGAPPPPSDGGEEVRCFFRFREPARATSYAEPSHDRTPVTVECERCGRRLRIRSGLAGRTGECPACGHLITIPGLGESASPSPDRRARDAQRRAHPPPGLSEPIAPEGVTAGGGPGPAVGSARPQPNRKVRFWVGLCGSLYKALGIYVVVVGLAGAAIMRDQLPLPEGTVERGAFLVGFLVGLLICCGLLWTLGSAVSKGSSGAVAAAFGQTVFAVLVVFCCGFSAVSPAVVLFAVCSLFVFIVALIHRKHFD
jgi:hypothetical protein